MSKIKEFLYVGHYIDVLGQYILKIGTTKNLERRKAQHNRYYKNAKHNPIREGNTFEYDFTLPLSAKNTHRYEDSNRAKWQAEGIGKFIRNDRFVCPTKPKSVELKIRKTYKVDL